MPIVIDTTPGVRVGLVLNPTSDGFPAELDIGDGSVYAPRAAAFPPPAPKPAYASSYDTEGSVSSDEAHYENREITVSMWVSGGGAPDVEEALNDLYRMVGQINREGGVLKFTTPNGTVCYFDLVQEASATLTVDYTYLWRNLADIELRLVARPFWRGDEVDLGTTSETSLPVLILTEAGQAGDVPSLGRLTVTDTESGGKDRWTVIVGGQSRFYSADATAALFYQAEDLTELGTTTATAGATGASGTVQRNTDLTTTYQALLKSEIDATNAALTHKGTFRVWARLYRPTGNTGAVSVRLEWGEGDYTRVTLNDPVAYATDEREGVFTWANLGVVTIDPESTQWEFRLLAKSTVAGDEIDVDCFALFPTEVVYTELSGKRTFQSPSSFLARDEFDHTAAASLVGKVAPVGGTWTTFGGDTSVFLTTGTEVKREAFSDTAMPNDSLAGSAVSLGTTAYAAIAAQVDITFPDPDPGVFSPPRAGFLIRAAATTNYAIGYVTTTTDYQAVVTLRKVVASSPADVSTVQLGYTLSPFPIYHTLRVLIDAAGRYYFWFGQRDQGIPPLVMQGQDASFVTGAALDDGMIGLYDGTAGDSWYRYYDNFVAFAPTSDAAIFSQQSLSLEHDRATRENSGGTFPTKISDRRGRYLKIPPAGPEGRSTRLAALALPNDPYTMGDAAAIYDLSAQLHVTPRGLVVPES
jgi:hypothetical protein